MSFPNPGPKEAGYSCAWKPAVSEVVVVLNPVVEEPKDVLPVVDSCQDGESVGVPFGPVHQRFVFIADGYSYRYLREVK